MIMWNVFSQTMTVGLNPAALPEGIGRGFNADYPDQLSAHLVVRNDGESNPRQRLYGPNYRGYYFLPQNASLRRENWKKFWSVWTIKGPNDFFSLQSLYLKWTIKALLKQTWKASS